MKLTTPVPISLFSNPIDYNSKMVLLGSCFTENIGSKLAYYGFDVSVNPFGIIFNSTSLRILVERAINNQVFTHEDVENHYSYFTHSDLNHTDTRSLIDNLNSALKELQITLKVATHLFITLGTSWVYKHIEKDMVVANCHKQPQRLFHKELLSIASISNDLKTIWSLLKSYNKDISITYTLSPVRHIKDGFIDNQRSKSRLHEAIQAQVDSHKASYFPAYEIAMDELRDYRFYARDMIHLNEVGIDFIWSRFRESGLNKTTLPQQKAIEKYRKLEQHRANDVISHTLQLQELHHQISNKFPEIKL